MSEVLQELARRKLPDALAGAEKENWPERRRELLEILEREEYGRFPAAPEAMEVVREERDIHTYAWKTVSEKLRFDVTVAGGKHFSFPVHFIFPKSEKPLPTVVFLNFRDQVPDRYWPVEEIADRGVAVMTVCYKDITPDNDDFTAGLPALYQSGERSGTDSGKINYWAWAALRLREYAATRPEVDPKNIAVLGHSRLGKTALVAAAHDPAFAFCFSNNSGCSGATLSRGSMPDLMKKPRDAAVTVMGHEIKTIEEDVDSITRIYHYWFCKNYARHALKQDKMPFDQHFLLSLIAPARLALGAAVEDVWADPMSEYLSLQAAARQVFSPLFGWEPLEAESYPSVGETRENEHLHFHYRPHAHFLSRYDWNQYLDFMLKNLN